MKPAVTARPLRIALALESDGVGGAEVVLLNLAESLRERGHQVIHVGPGHRTGWLGERFKERGFETAICSIRKALDWSALRALVSTYRRLGVDVVHSHEFAMAVYGTAATRFLRLPHVITLHGGRDAAAAYRRRVALRWAVRHSSRTVAVSSMTREWFVQDFGVDASEVDVVWNGVPQRLGSGEQFREEIGAGAEILILAVGNLEPWKGHEILVRALAGVKLPAGRDGWRLVIAGGRGGSQQAALEQLAASLGVADRVHLLLNRQDVPSLLAAADVFVMPSLTEGMPLALLEAMLAGRPTIASCVGGIPEAITTEEHGLLVPPNDVAALRGALSRLMADPAERARLAEAGRQRAERDFSAAVMAARYEAIYRR